MKTKEIIYSIIEKTSALQISDDSLIEEAYVMYLMNVYRLILLRDRYKAKETISSAFYQMDCCVPVKCNSIVCNGFDSGDDMFFADLNSEVVTGINDRGILFVGNTGFNDRSAITNTAYDRLSWQQFLSLSSAQWTSRRAGYYPMKNYRDGNGDRQDILLLKNMHTDGLKSLCVYAIFTEPQNAICNDKFDSFEYPIDGDLIGKLELLCIKDIMNAEKGNIGDPVNDMADIKSFMLQQQMNNGQNVEQPKE